MDDNNISDYIVAITKTMGTKTWVDMVTIFHREQPELFTFINSLAKLREQTGLPITHSECFNMIFAGVIFGRKIQNISLAKVSEN